MWFVLHGKTDRNTTDKSDWLELKEYVVATYHRTAAQRKAAVYRFLWHANTACLPCHFLIVDGRVDPPVTLSEQAGKRLRTIRHRNIVSIQIRETALTGVLLIEPRCFRDERGFFKNRTDFGSDGACPPKGDHCGGSASSSWGVSIPPLCDDWTNSPRDAVLSGRQLRR
jgi:hypothetical protein